jgi:hypothetical protein
MPTDKKFQENDDPAPNFVNFLEEELLKPLDATGAEFITSVLAWKPHTNSEQNLFSGRQTNDDL